MIIRNEEQKRFYELEKEQRRFIADCFVNDEMDRLEFRVLGFSHDADGSCGKWIPLGRKSTLHRNGIYRIASHGPIKVKWDRIDERWKYVAIDNFKQVLLLKSPHGHAPEVGSHPYEKNNLGWCLRGTGEVRNVTSVFPADTFEIPSGLKWEESLTMRPRDA